MSQSVTGCRMIGVSRGNRIHFDFKADSIHISFFLSSAALIECISPASNAPLCTLAFLIIFCYHPSILASSSYPLMNAVQ